MPTRAFLKMREPAIHKCASLCATSHGPVGTGWKVLSCVAGLQRLWTAFRWGSSPCGQLDQVASAE